MVQIGDKLPFSPVLWLCKPNGDGQVEGLRIAQLGLCRRILLVGITSAFTPECWNTHLYQVLSNLDSYLEFGVKAIYVIATDDPYVMAEWKLHLDLPDIFVMLSDTSKRFTQLMGLGHIHPRMSGNIRCRRFVILADNTSVKQLLIAPDSGKELLICPHIGHALVTADQLKRKRYRPRFKKSLKNG